MLMNARFAPRLMLATLPATGEVKTTPVVFLSEKKNLALGDGLAFSDCHCGFHTGIIVAENGDASDRFRAVDLLGWRTSNG